VNATCTNPTAEAMAPVQEAAESRDRTDNFLYQAATVLAILLFLISF
jgi:hypothetical protein